MEVACLSSNKAPRHCQCDGGTRTVVHNYLREKANTQSFVQFADGCIETTQTTVSSGTSEDCLFGNVLLKFLHSLQIH